MGRLDIKLSDFDPTNSDAAYGKHVAAAGDAAVQAVGGPPGVVTAGAEAIQGANEVTDNMLTLNNIRQIADAHEGTSESSISSMPDDAEPFTQYNPETGSNTQYHDDGDFTKFHADGDVWNFDSSTGDSTYYEAQTGETSIYNLDGDIVS